MDKKERAAKEEARGKFKEFDNIRDLIFDLHGMMRPCNNPGCTTCVCICPWKGKEMSE